MNSLVIRADASPEIGVGHVMRMIALVQAWLGRGGEVVFVFGFCPEFLQKRLIDEGAELVPVDAITPGSESDAGATVEVVSRINADWVVLDGYQFGESYQSQLKQSGARLLVVDDFCYSDRWVADAILNHNIHSVDISYQNSQPDSVELKGSRFVLLREEFRAVSPPSDSKASGAVKRLLVTLGGADIENYSGAILKLVEAYPDKIEVRLLVGPSNPNMKKLQDLAENSAHSVEVLVNVSDMPAQYHWADGIISASGGTCWEWLYFGLRGAIISIAKNQEGVYRSLVDRDLAYGLGFENSLIGGESGADHIGKFLAAEHSLSSDRLIDGYGGARVAAFLDNGFWIREAVLSDCKTYFNWANDPAVRENSLNSAEIDWDNHVGWFNSRIESNDSRLYVAMTVDDDCCAQVRFELSDPETAVINFSVDQSYRGRGLGSVVLVLGMVAEKKKGVTKFVALVKEANRASARIFEKLGFESMGQSEFEGVLSFQLSIND